MIPPQNQKTLLVEGLVFTRVLVLPTRNVIFHSFLHPHLFPWCERSFFTAAIVSVLNPCQSMPFAQEMPSDCTACLGRCKAPDGCAQHRLDLTAKVKKNRTNTTTPKLPDDISFNQCKNTLDLYSHMKLQAVLSLILIDQHSITQMLYMSLLSLVKRLYGDLFPFSIVAKGIKTTKRDFPSGARM